MVQIVPLYYRFFYIHVRQPEMEKVFGDLQLHPNFFFYKNGNFTHQWKNNLNNSQTSYLIKVGLLRLSV